MGVLSDARIKELVSCGALVIDPFQPDKFLGPVSLDLSVGNSFDVFTGFHQFSSIHLSDLKKIAALKKRITTERFILHPNGFAIAYSEQRIEIPPNIVGLVTARSGWARIALQVESAFLIQPNWKGKLALELVNNFPIPLVIKTGDLLCQVMFMTVDTAVDVLYGQKGNEKYQHQEI